MFEAKRGYCTRHRSMLKSCSAQYKHSDPAPDSVNIRQKSEHCTEKKHEKISKQDKIYCVNSSLYWW